MIKLFTNKEQIRLPNNKSTDLDWYYSNHNWKLKLLIRDLLFTTFVKNLPVVTTITRITTARSIITNSGVSIQTLES